ncbi:DNA-binding protein [Nonomuraea sp. SMC257]|uniref:DNA-binding protein n=1 Tax=Nonomuraea montanisoli TaxID=2741721 RepID=A0A7Y6IFK9_9ACTN|nr:DNA-binding protein [Nonomuraea montanisoli]NUW37348.1 DNA-binding protein [Nonomuraea montanisoli]
MTETPQARELLKAGAVLPPGTEGAGENAVPLVARAYRHPVLDDRVVVRLVADELRPAEDLAAGFLGLEPEGEPEVVGVGQRRSLGFPEWVLARHPDDGHHALAVVPELERIARQAKSKPKAALDAYQELAGRLAASVPHFLPTFYEQAGRVFTGVENATYAGQMFSHARRAEAQYGLDVDEDRLDAVFLEFALAGALPVKALSGYAKELAGRLPADEALRRFTRLCLRRTAGGLQPSAQMAQDLRKLARAAKIDADAAERAYLAELIVLPATLRAATGWWKSHAPAVTALAQADPAVRATLLEIMPEARDHDMPAVWLEILEFSGAMRELAEGELRPADGVAGWLTRFLAFRDRPYGRPPRLPALYALVERLGGPLRTELTAAGRTFKALEDVDLLDLLLSMDVPVADPGEHHWLVLEHWAGSEERRDLVALEADGRFRAAFKSSAYRLSDDDSGRRAIRLLTESPGGRPMLAEWMREVALRSSAAGLPGLPDAMRRLAWLPGEALLLAEEEVREAAAADVAEVLARTLRTGLIDELGWPAWDDAAATLVHRDMPHEIVVADAWPYAIVAGPGQVRVLGPEGVVLTHDLRVPADETWGDHGFHYVDGELLVYWRSRTRDHRLRGYWHTAPDRILDLEGDNSVRGVKLDYHRGDDPVSLALPGGGRTTGHDVLHRGDTSVPSERTVISDGTSFWVWSWEENYGATVGWYEFDPVSGRRGRMGMPGFLADAVRDAPAGSAFMTGRLLPAPSDAPTPVGTPVNGVLGWRVVRLPDGSVRGEDAGGTTVTVPDDVGVPVSALMFPGAERACAVIRGSYRVELVGSDGVLTATMKTDRTPGSFGKGTIILPPVRYWTYFEPRDPEGSAVLRGIDGGTAAALLKAAESAAGTKSTGEDDLAAQIRALLPGVTDDALVAGIAGVARFAAQQQAALRDVVARLGEALAGGSRSRGPAGPFDDVIVEALSGLNVHADGYWHRTERDGLFRQIQAVGELLSEPDGSRPAPPAQGAPSGGSQAAPPARLHLDLPELPGSRLRWLATLDHAAAVAFRAASATTGSEHRATLRTLLTELRERGLPLSAAPERWRRMTLQLDDRHLTGIDGEWRNGTWVGTLPLDGGAFVVLATLLDHTSPRVTWDALVHDPRGRFEVPPPYTVTSSSPVGGNRPSGWTETFLAELEARGPAPWRAEAVEEFARLTGVSRTLSALVVAGMPDVDSYQRGFLTKEARTTLGVKVADAAVARDQLRDLEPGVRQAVVSALLPADPARLWTDGPDAAAAAEVWNAQVGRQAAVPEWLLAEAGRAVKGEWDTGRALRALMDPAATPELSRDLSWSVQGDRVRPVGGQDAGFDADTLASFVPMAAWLAHRLPVGDPIRAALPAALAAVHDRLAAPELVLDLDRYIALPRYVQVAGAPTETGEGFVRYGSLILPTADDRPAPGIRVALLDGDDPYLRALLGMEQPFAAETALRVARDPRFEALLAGPAGADGEQWWPQDPTRSVPELVAEAAATHGLGADAGALYLMLLAMPDPADRNVARWTGWKPARLKAVRAELAATDLVIEAERRRAGRSLFLPGGWTDLAAPSLPVEQWKLSMLQSCPGAPLVPLEPAADLYARAWARVREGDLPRYEELKVARRGRRR